MSKWVAIKYREFYDVPRIFLVEHRGRLLLFDGLFNEAIDEYPNDYKVYLMSPLRDEDTSGSWLGLRDKAIRPLGTIPVANLRFDSTHRREIDTEPIDEWAAKSGWWVD
jgi:hypothetical protein